MKINLVANNINLVADINRIDRAVNKVAREVQLHSSFFCVRLAAHVSNGCKS